MTSPIPGVTYPDARTWSAGDFITVPRVRAEMYNLAAIYAGGARPVLVGLNNVAPVPTASVNTFIGITSVSSLNSWNVNTAPAGFTPAAFLIPFAGYWLLQSDVTFTIGASAGNSRYSAGFLTAANGTINGLVDGGTLPASTTTGQVCGVGNCDVYQFNVASNTSNGDYVQPYVFTSNANVGTVRNAFYMFEWIGLPTSGLTSYTGPYGTIATPVAAASYPSGQGTTITNGGGVAAGATSITVADATGMHAGGTLGLDYINSQLYQPYAETVTISSVVGTTVGISATAYAHAQGAPVAVPVGSAFLNQQLRDQVNFLAYPPVFKGEPNPAQLIPTQVFPAGTKLTTLTARIDTFSGYSSPNYTVPAAGVYFVYGQVYYVGISTGSFTFSAGIQQNSGTVQWGVRARANTSSVVPFCATVRRMIRCAAGDTISLYAFQDSGSSMNTIANLGGGQTCKLIVVWRSF